MAKNGGNKMDFVVVVFVFNIVAYRLIGFQSKTMLTIVKWCFIVFFLNYAFTSIEYVTTSLNHEP